MVIGESVITIGENPFIDCSMLVSIEISNTDKVKNIAIQYKAENGNDVAVSIKVGYTQVIKFSLPTVE